MDHLYLNNIEAIIDLQGRGYDHDFVISDEHIICVQEGQTICPDEFEVIEAYRFEGKKKLCDNCVIYAIRSFNYDLSGILMTSYRRLTIGVSIHLWSKLATNL